MKYPIDAVNFAGRLTPDDLTLLNEAIPMIVPESVDYNDDKQLTGRVVLMSAVERAVSNVKKATVSLPKDLQRIAELEEKLAEAKSSLTDLKSQIEAYDKTIEQNSLKIQEQADQLENLRIQASESGQKAAKLEQFKPGENEMRIELQPFTKEVLIRYARKASAMAKKEVRPGDVLTSLFNRYITSADVELDGFPLLIKKSELKTIAENLKKANEPAE